MYRTIEVNVRRLSPSSRHHWLVNHCYLHHCQPPNPLLTSERHKVGDWMMAMRHQGKRLWWGQGRLGWWHWGHIGEERCRWGWGWSGWWQWGNVGPRLLLVIPLPSSLPVNFFQFATATDVDLLQIGDEYFNKMFWQDKREFVCVCRQIQGGHWRGRERIYNFAAIAEGGHTILECPKIIFLTINRSSDNHLFKATPN